jgi:hypothetical protein
MKKILAPISARLKGSGEGALAPRSGVVSRQCFDEVDEGAQQRWAPNMLLIPGTSSVAHLWEIRRCRTEFAG